MGWAGIALFWWEESTGGRERKIKKGAVSETDRSAGNRQHFEKKGEERKHTYMKRMKGGFRLNNVVAHMMDKQNPEEGDGPMATLSDCSHPEKKSPNIKRKEM